MADHQNFTNGDQTFNIYLESNGDLQFKANGRGGDGETRMAIADTSGDVTIGGSPQRHGRLRVLDAWGGTVGFIGQVGEEALLTLGALSSSGRLRITSLGGRTTTDLDGQRGTVTIGAEEGEMAGHLSVLDHQGNVTSELLGGHLRLYKPDGELGADLHVGAPIGAAHLHLNGSEGGPKVELRGEQARILLTDDRGETRVDLDGRTGHLALLDAEGEAAITLQADTNSLAVLDRQGDRKVELLGTVGLLRLFDNAGGVVAELNADSDLILGGGEVADTHHGSIRLLNADGIPKIVCEASSGSIVCDTLTENSDVRLKANVEPLVNALGKLMSLRGVRYKSRQTIESTARGEAVPQIGFVGQELEAVCPELVATDAEGYKSVHYSRVSAVLVEAVKEQQQVIREQAATLNETLRRLSLLEASMATREEAI